MPLTLELTFRAADTIRDLFDIFIHPEINQVDRDFSFVTLAIQIRVFGLWRKKFASQRARAGARKAFHGPPAV